MPLTTILRLIIFLILISLTISQHLNAGLGLLCGVVFAIVFGNPWRPFTQKWAGFILKTSVVGLGFGLNLQTLWSTTQNGFFLTISTIAFALTVGLLLGRLLGVDGKLSTLISTGTSICGGSAIAAMSPTIGAKQEQTVVAISIVFFLNGIGLYVYPWLGHYFDLSQQQFGLWAALGIHDTSSVVGAASLYGEEALKVATSTKLARAMWIIPLVLGASLLNRRKTNQKNPVKINIPYFILFFALASAVTTFAPPANAMTPILLKMAKIGLVLSLLLMGAGFTREMIKSLNIRPMIQAVGLWILVSVGTLLVVLNLQIT